MKKRRSFWITLVSCICFSVFLSCDPNPNMDNSDGKNKSGKESNCKVHSIKNKGCPVHFSIDLINIPSTQGVYYGKTTEEQTDNKRRYLQKISYYVISYLIKELNMKLSISEDFFKQEYRNLDLNKQNVSLKTPADFDKILIGWFKKQTTITKKAIYVRVFKQSKDKTYLYQFFEPGGKESISIGPIVNGGSITRDIVTDRNRLFYLFPPLSTRIYYGQENKGVQILNDPIQGIIIDGNAYLQEVQFNDLKLFFQDKQGLKRKESSLNDLPKASIKIEIVTSQTDKVDKLDKKEIQILDQDLNLNS